MVVPGLIEVRVRGPSVLFAERKNMGGTRNEIITGSKIWLWRKIYLEVISNRKE